MDNTTFRQPRESRVLAGVVVTIFAVAALLFSTLAALESFFQHPLVISLVILASTTMFVFGLYFIFCAPIMSIDATHQRILMGKSCFLFNTSSQISFNTIREVGIKKEYHAGDRGEEKGDIYFVEIRGRRNLTVPGSKDRSIKATELLANDIAGNIGVKFNPKIRNVFTGSAKLRN